MGRDTVDTAQEHQLGAIVGDGHSFDFVEKLLPDALSTHGSRDHHVFQDAEGLGPIHDIGTEGEESGCPDLAVHLGNEEKTGCRARERRHLSGEEVDLRIVDEFTVEGFD
jgi:hypothetical protein